MGKKAKILRKQLKREQKQKKEVNGQMNGQIKGQINGHTASTVQQAGQAVQSAQPPLVYVFVDPNRAHQMNNIIYNNMANQIKINQQNSINQQINQQQIHQ